MCTDTYLFFLEAGCRINDNCDQFLRELPTMRRKMPRIEPHVIQNEHEHCRDCGLACTGEGGRQNINPIKQLYHRLDLIIPWHVEPEVLKDFLDEFLPRL